VTVQAVKVGRERSIAAGANACIPNPMVPDLLLQQKTLHLKHEWIGKEHD
jgi:hypothetical protein